MSSYNPHIEPAIAMTVIIKVFDNVLSHMDNGIAVFLALCDLSAAFETVYYRIFLRLLCEPVK